MPSFGGFSLSVEAAEAEDVAAAEEVAVCGIGSSMDEEPVSEEADFPQPKSSAAVMAETSIIETDLFICGPLCESQGHNTVKTGKMHLIIKRNIQ
jgi:hypothetical protein